MCKLAESFQFLKGSEGGCPLTPLNSATSRFFLSSTSPLHIVHTFHHNLLHGLGLALTLAQNGLRIVAEIVTSIQSIIVRRHVTTSLSFPLLVASS